MNVADLGLGHVELMRSAAGAGVPEVARRYGPPAGLPALRDAIARREGVAGTNIVLTTGASMGLVATLAILERPARILLPRPFYPAYPAIAQALGLQVDYYGVSDSAGGMLGQIAATITQETAAIVVNSPGNPLGNIISPAILGEICEIAASRDALLIVDEVYKDFQSDGANGAGRPNWVQPELVVRINSFSKTFGMPGERLGYVIAQPDLSARLTTTHWHLAMGAPLSAQYLALDLLASKDANAWSGIAAQLACNRGRAVRILAEQADLNIKPPEAGIFLWIETGLAGLPSTMLADLLRLVEGVHVQPASLFGLDGPDLRASIAVTDDVLTRGFSTIAHTLRRLRKEMFAR
jgi:aspartate aminotransferase